MKTSASIKPQSAPSGSGSPSTPGAAVVGWLLVCFAIIPLSMAAHGEGRGPVETGVAMLVLGLGMVIGSKILRRRGRPPGPNAPAV